MISPARRICYKLLYQIGSRRLFSDDAIHSKNLQDLDRRDKNLIAEIIYGCLRWQSLLDYIFSRSSSRPWEEVDPGARILLRMSLYQMWKMDRIPDHALVNDAVELAKHELGKGIDKFINAVLRKITRTRDWEKKELLNAPPWVQVSLPEWLWERWSKRFGAEIGYEYAMSLTETPAISWRCPERQPEIFSTAASDLVPGAYIQERRDLDFTDKHALEFQRQDEASQLIPHLLGPVEGWTIWDCCAAPGGKSAILSYKCGRTGRLIASDFQEKRIPLLINALKTLSIRNNEVLVADASIAPPFRGKFDAVIVDAPCSGLGTLRRNPEIKWNFKPEEFGELQQRQTEILNSASKAVRDGGVLLYSTCSTESEENEDVIQIFLKSNPLFRLSRPCYPAGIESWIGADNLVRTFPSSRLWDGFFAGLMVRI